MKFFNLGTFSRFYPLPLFAPKTDCWKKQVMYVHPFNKSHVLRIILKKNRCNGWMVFRRYNGWMVFQQYNGWMVFQRIFTLVEWCSINAMVEWCSNGYSHWLNGVPLIQWVNGVPTDIYNGWGAPSLTNTGVKKICGIPLYYVVRLESADYWPIFCCSCSLVHSVVKLAPDPRFQSDVSAPACARPCTRCLL